MVDAVWHAAEYCDSSPVGVHDDFVMGGKSTIEVLVRVCFKWCSHKGLDPSKIISSHVAPLSMRVINSFQIVGAACLARIALRVPSAGPDLLSATFGTIFGVCVKPGATSENDAFILQHAVDASMCCFMLELINAVSGNRGGSRVFARSDPPLGCARSLYPWPSCPEIPPGRSASCSVRCPFRSSLLIALRKLLSTTLMGNDSSPSLLAAILRCLCLLFDNMSDMREEIAMMVGQIFTKGSELLVITTCREVSVLLRAYADANPADIDEGIVDGVAALRRELLSRIRKRVSLLEFQTTKRAEERARGELKLVPVESCSCPRLTSIHGKAHQKGGHQTNWVHYSTLAHLQQKYATLIPMTHTCQHLPDRVCSQVTSWLRSWVQWIGHALRQRTMATI